MRKRVVTIKPIYIIFLIALISTIYVIWPVLFVGKQYELVDDLYNLPNPVQFNHTGSNTIEKGSTNINVTYVAKYSISGRVVDVQKYGGEKMPNDISPVDFGIVWGIWARNEYINKISWTSYGNRYLSWRTSDASWMYALGGKSEFDMHWSNNHIIPANDDIRKKALAVRKNDFIKMDGYLVNISAKKGKYSYNWNSSTSRLDTGDGACEVMYVENIVWLRGK